MKPIVFIYDCQIKIFEHYKSKYWLFSMILVLKARCVSILISCIFSVKLWFENSHYEFI